MNRTQERLSVLRDMGYRPKDIAKELDISYQKVSAIQRTGKAGDYYQKIYNVYRRKSYQYYREKGVNPGLARAARTRIKPQETHELVENMKKIRELDIRDIFKMVIDRMYPKK